MENVNNLLCCEVFIMFVLNVIIESIDLFFLLKIVIYNINICEISSVSYLAFFPFFYLLTIRERKYL